MKEKEPLRKTYCELEEEKFYSSKRKNISDSDPRVLIMMIVGFFCVFGICFATNENASHHEKTHWDGAGDTWTCRKCGTTNYNWQASCGGCKAWQ